MVRGGEEVRVKLGNLERKLLFFVRFNDLEGPKLLAFDVLVAV